LNIGKIFGAQKMKTPMVARDTPLPLKDILGDSLGN
jgi:hypothetical protein